MPWIPHITYPQLINSNVLKCVVCFIIYIFKSFFLVYPPMGNSLLLGNRGRQLPFLLLLGRYAAIDLSRRVDKAHCSIYSFMIVLISQSYQDYWCHYETNKHKIKILVHIWRTFIWFCFSFRGKFFTLVVNFLLFVSYRVYFLFNWMGSCVLFLSSSLQMLFEYYTTQCCQANVFAF